MSRYVMALDQGTTSSRALLFDRSGQVCGVGQREFAQHFRHPGWVEHDAEEIWNSQVAAGREALEAAGASAGDVAAIGITNQRETAVVWDRATGEAIHPAVVWQSRQTIRSAMNFVRAVWTKKCGLVPGCGSTPIFPRRRSDSSSTRCPAPRSAQRAVSCALAPWTHGCSFG